MAEDGRPTYTETPFPVSKYLTPDLGSMTQEQTVELLQACIAELPLDVTIQVLIGALEKDEVHQLLDAAEERIQSDAEDEAQERIERGPG